MVLDDEDADAVGSCSTSRQAPRHRNGPRFAGHGGNSTGAIVCDVFLNRRRIPSSPSMRPTAVSTRGGGPGIAVAMPYCRTGMFDVDRRP
jgi:hypothetical protein